MPTFVELNDEDYDAFLLYQSMPAAVRAAVREIVRATAPARAAGRVRGPRPDASTVRTRVVSGDRAARSALGSPETPR